RPEPPEPYETAVGVRRLHVLLRRSDAAARRRDRRARLPETGRPHAGPGAARRRPPEAIRGRKLLRCLDALLQAGRKLAQRPGQLLHQGRAGRLGAGPGNPPPVRWDTQPGRCDAPAVATLRPRLLPGPPAG